MDIRTSGAQIASASENIDETPSGKLLHGIMATIAEFYSSNLAAEARKGMEQKAKVGGTPFMAPLGYRNAPVLVEGREVRSVVVDPDRAPHIRWAYESFATGEWTVSQMAEALAERGLRTLGNRRYSPGPLARSKVHQMLRNPYYVGIVTYNGVRYSGRHDPLIDLPLFEDVQEVLNMRSQGGERPIKRTHYLKGMVACGPCGRRLGISWNAGRNGATFPYFFCLGRRAHNSNDCKLPYLPMEQVESDVEAYWRRVRITDSELTQIRGGVGGLIGAASEERTADIQSQEDRLKRLAVEEQKLLKAHYADAISLPLLREEQQRILQERASAEGQLAALTMEFEAIQRTLDAALARVDRCDEVYVAGSPQVRRELCFGLFNRLYLTIDGVVGADLASPFAEILDPELEAQVEAGRAAIEDGRLGDLLGASGKVAPANGDHGPWRAASMIERPQGLLSWENKEPRPKEAGVSNVNLLVGEGGLEPPRPFGHWNLNPARLPIPPLARVAGAT